MPEIQRIFDLEGTLADPGFIEEEVEAVRDEVTYLSPCLGLKFTCPLVTQGGGRLNVVLAAVSKEVVLNRLASPR